MIDGADGLFKTTTFNDLYLYVRGKRQEFGMEIDSDRSFEEIKDTITRFRKIVGNVRTQADECRSWDELQSLMLKKIETADDVPLDRNEMVVFAMRNDWMIETYNYISQMIQEGEDDGR
jgi:hypothetical protein